MKKMMSIIVFAMLYNLIGIAQTFELSGEIRPRYESRKGFSSLRSSGQEAGSFISQRTRLNVDYKQDKLKFKVNLQNVRVWGDISTLASDDKATALHETWAEAILSEKISLKIGRQEIAYDDHRIFGNVGWAQQARSHDAFLLKFKPTLNSELDVGFALNADAQNNRKVLYSNVAGYKSLQYAWYHTKLNKIGLSFLLLNTGREYELNNEIEIDFMQTLGTRMTYQVDKLSANISAYLQIGKSTNKDVNAQYLGANVTYKVSDNFNVAAGLEFLSGKDMNDVDTEVKSFAPLFGTNHKFNGWMDYFYVGNHGASVGLKDFYLSLIYKKEKFTAKIIPHFFASAASIINNTERLEDRLGTELDFMLAYEINEVFSIHAGYSQMFATDSMEVLKGGDKELSNNWTWIMFTFKPTLFSYTSNKK